MRGAEAEGFDPAAAPVVERAAGALLIARPGGSTPEFLMMKRPITHRFGPGQFVFPGGKVEDADRHGRSATDAARMAAIRETREEMGLQIAADAAPLLFRWITPKGVPIRFDARFYLAVCEEDLQPRPSSDEVDSWHWVSAAAAVESFTANRMPMMFPTVRSMELLALLPDLGSLQAFAQASPAPPIEPRIQNGEDGVQISLPPEWQALEELARKIGGR